MLELIAYVVILVVLLVSVGAIVGYIRLDAKLIRLSDPRVCTVGEMLQEIDEAWYRPIVRLMYPEDPAISHIAEDLFCIGLYSARGVLHKYCIVGDSVRDSFKLLTDMRDRCTRRENKLWEQSLEHVM